jgi:lauroyl/myristoyl acyltransferase
MSHPWRLTGAGVAAAISLLPRTRRFGAAVLLARPLIAIIRRAPQYRLLEDASFDSGIGIALHLLLHTFTRNGAAFDPLITIEGYERLVAAHRRGCGVLLVSPHAPLVLLMLRRFHDEGLMPVVVAADPNLRIPGTRVTAETVQRSAMSLLRIRARLRQGRLVCAMIDRSAHEPKARTVELHTARGRVIIAPALLHLAARCEASVAFCEAHLEGGRVRGTIAVPSSTSEAGVEREYIDFIHSLMRSRTASAAHAQVAPAAR